MIFELSTKRKIFFRTKLDLGNADISTRGPPSIPDSKSGQYLEFTASDLDKDVAQTTIPFIETQQVVPQPYILLSGLGVHHKGREGYGGFLSPQVFTFDYAEHLQPMMNEFPDSNNLRDNSRENYDVYANPS